MFLAVSSFAAMSVNLSTWLVGDGHPKLAQDPLGTAALAAVYGCLLWALFFVGFSLWIITWETYYDFPTLRRMVRGPLIKLAATPEDLSDSSRQPTLRTSRSGSDASNFESVRREKRRSIVLVTPLVVLTLSHVVMVVGEHICGSNPGLCTVGTGIFLTTSRMNKITQLILFISQVQMIVTWSCLFPRWELAFVGGHRSMYSLTHMLALTLQVFMAPSLIGQGVLWCCGFSPHKVLMLLWSIWFLLASVVIARPENSQRVGFSFSTVTDDGQWRQVSTGFKLTGISWVMAHLFREVAGHGLESAQQDLILIGVVYPLFWFILWTLTYVAVASSRFNRQYHWAMWTMALLSAFATWLLCKSVGRGRLPLVLILVWICLFSCSCRILRRLGVGSNDSTSQSSRVLSRRPTTKFAVTPSVSERTQERKVVRCAGSLLWVILVLFCCVLVACVVLAGRQHSQGQAIDKNRFVWQASELRKPAPGRQR